MTRMLNEQHLKSVVAKRDKPTKVKIDTSPSHFYLTSFTDIVLNYSICTDNLSHPHHMLLEQSPLNGTTLPLLCLHQPF